MSLNFYTQDNPPSGGNAKKIWEALWDNDLEPSTLHYNANCWGQGKDLGWGTWGCVTIVGDMWCGISQGQVYVQAMGAPYWVKWLKKPGQKYRTTAARNER